jgi:hypothetical protein
VVATFAIGVFFLAAGLLTGFLTARVPDFFTDLFAGFFLADFLLVFRRLAMERPSATRTVDWPRLVERVVEGAAATALGLERFVAADDAIAVALFVRSEASADGAVLGDLSGHGRNLKTERIPGAFGIRSALLA